MNLLEDITREVKRCEELLEAYDETGKPRMFAAIMLRQDIKKAEKARDSGEITEMVGAINMLKRCK